MDRYIAPRSPGSRAVPAYEPNGGLTTELMGALERAVPVATLVFVLSSMLAMGFGLKVAQIAAVHAGGLEEVEKSFVGGDQTDTANSVKEPPEPTTFLIGRGGGWPTR